MAQHITDYHHSNVAALIHCIRARHFLFLVIADCRPVQLIKWLARSVLSSPLCSNHYTILPPPTSSDVLNCIISSTSLTLLHLLNFLFCLTNAIMLNCFQKVPVANLSVIQPALTRFSFLSLLLHQLRRRRRKRSGVRGDGSIPRHCCISSHCTQLPHTSLSTLQRCAYVFEY